MSIRRTWWRRGVCVLTATGILGMSILPCRAQPFSSTVSQLPAPGAMVNLSPGFQPPVLKGIQLDPQEPFHLKFFVDSGEAQLEEVQLKDESTKLIEYFLASLTVPDNDLWVNLSPAEKDRIIPEAFGTTRMGRDLLEEDYLLKQLTATLLYPEKDLGKDFWQKVRAKAKKLYGTDELPLNTFQKVWVLPDKAVVYQNNGMAFIAQSSLKVMLEKDYVALDKSLEGATATKKDTSQLSNDIIRELILPEIEHEVNQGKNFATLRQVYHSLILAAWFKRNLKEGLIGQIYTGQNKVNGIDLVDKNMKHQIYEQYLAAFQKGVFNYIKEEEDAQTRQTIPRKYFSGGFSGQKMVANITTTDDAAQVHVRGKLTAHEVFLVPHRIVNRYIREHLPEDLRSEDKAVRRERILQYPRVEKNKTSARLVPIPGLLKNTGQFAHVGLGQTYDEPVIYIDEAYKYNRDIQIHDLDEIAQWESLRTELNFIPAQMRQWIKDNFEDAREFAAEFHKKSHSIAQVFAEARRRGFLPSLTDVTQLYPEDGEQAKIETDINIAAGNPSPPAFAAALQAVPYNEFLRTGQALRVVYSALSELDEDQEGDRIAALKDFRRLVSLDIFNQSLLDRLQLVEKLKEKVLTGTPMENIMASLVLVELKNKNLLPAPLWSDPAIGQKISTRLHNYLVNISTITKDRSPRVDYNEMLGMVTSLYLLVKDGLLPTDFISQFPALTDAEVLHHVFQQVIASEEIASTDLLLDEVWWWVLRFLMEEGKVTKEQINIQLVPLLKKILLSQDFSLKAADFLVSLRAKGLLIEEIVFDEKQLQVSGESNFGLLPANILEGFTGNLAEEAAKLKESLPFLSRDIARRDPSSWKRKEKFLTLLTGVIKNDFITQETFNHLDMWEAVRHNLVMDAFWADGKDFLATLELIQTLVKKGWTDNNFLSSAEFHKALIERLATKLQSSDQHTRETIKPLQQSSLLTKENLVSSGIIHEIVVGMAVRGSGKTAENLLEEQRKAFVVFKELADLDLLDPTAVKNEKVTEKILEQISNTNYSTVLEGFKAIASFHEHHLIPENITIDKSLQEWLLNGFFSPEEGVVEWRAKSIILLQSKGLWQAGLIPADTILSMEDKLENALENDRIKPNKTIALNLIHYLGEFKSHGLLPADYQLAEKRVKRVTDWWFNISSKGRFVEYLHEYQLAKLKPLSDKNLRHIFSMFNRKSSAKISEFFERAIRLDLVTPDQVEIYVLPWVFDIVLTDREEESKESLAALTALLKEKGILRPVVDIDFEDLYRVAQVGMDTSGLNGGNDELKTRLAMLIWVDSMRRDELKSDDFARLKDFVRSMPPGRELNILLSIFNWYTHHRNSEAQEFLEGQIKKILQRKDLNAHGKLSLSPKEKRFVEAVEQSHTLRSLIPFILDSRLYVDDRFGPFGQLAEQGYIDQAYLQGVVWGVEEFFDVMAKLAREFGTVPPRQLTEDVFLKKRSVEELKTVNDELKKIIAANDYRNLIKALAADEQKMEAYYLLHQPPFQYPGTDPISYHRFKDLVERAVKSLEKTDDDLMDEVKLALRINGLDDQRGEEIAAALLEGRPPLPKDSPYLDQDGNFIPQRVDILAKVSKSDQIQQAKRSFTSGADSFVFLLKINDLLKRIFVGISKRLEGQTEVQAQFQEKYEAIRKGIQPEADLKSIYEKLLALNNELYPVVGQKRPIENLMAETINRAIHNLPRARGIFMGDKPWTSEDGNVLEFQRLDIEELLRRMPTLVRELADKKARNRLNKIENKIVNGEPANSGHVLKIFLEQLRLALKFDSNDEGLHMNYQDLVRQITASFENYQKTVQSEIGSEEIPPALYVDFIRKTNLFELFRFSDGAHCCLSSDPKVSIQWNYDGLETDLYEREIPRFLTNATTFFWQFTTEPRGGKQVGWFENWFGVGPVAQGIVGTEYMYLNPAYHDQNIQKALLEKVEEILFSTRVAMIAQAVPPKVSDNALTPPADYRQQVMQVFKIQTLYDGDPMYEDARMEGNVEVDYPFRVKRNPQLLARSLDHVANLDIIFKQHPQKEKIISIFRENWNPQKQYFRLLFLQNALIEKLGRNDGLWTLREWLEVYGGIIRWDDKEIKITNLAEVPVDLAQMGKEGASAPSDSAMLGARDLKAKEAPGGIDFSDHNLNLELQGEPKLWEGQVPASTILNIPIEGFTPIIFQIIPVTNWPMLLKESPPVEKQLSLR